jgi:hypothetical protein
MLEPTLTVGGVIMALFQDLIANLPAGAKKEEYQFFETEEIIRILEEYGYRTRAAEPDPRRIGDEVRVRRRRGDVNDIREREARFAVVKPGEDFQVWADGDYESVPVESILGVVREIIDLLGTPSNRKSLNDDDESYGL